MKQSILIEPRHSQVKEMPVPTPGEEDVLVQMKACGVCASELHGWQGDSHPYPRQLGHEVSGEVAAVGSHVQEFKPGMRVTGLFGRGFAEYALTHQSLVTPIPEGIAYEHALGEPLGCIFSGARRTHIELGDTVAVIGLGFMGLLMLQALRLRGAGQLFVIDPRPEARQAALKLGATETLSPDMIPDHLVMTEWGKLGKGYGVNVVIEACGTQAGLTLAGEMVREHGLLSIVGFHQGGLRQVNMEMWNWKAFDVINAHERRNDYLMDSMRRGLNFLAAGKLEMAALVTHRFGLAQIDEAFQSLEGKPAGYLKSVVKF